MSNLKKTTSLLLAILTVAIFVGLAPIAEAQMAYGIGKVEKVAQLPEGIFIEGSVIDREGNIWFVEIGSGWISKVTPQGKYEKF